MSGIVLFPEVGYPLLPSYIETRWPAELIENSFFSTDMHDPNQRARNIIAFRLIELCQKMDSWEPFDEATVIGSVPLPRETFDKFVHEFARLVVSADRSKRYFIKHDFVAKCFAIRPRLSGLRLGLKPFAEIKIGTLVESPFTGRRGEVVDKVPADTPDWLGDPERAVVWILWQGESEASGMPLCDLENIHICYDDPEADRVPLPK